MIDTYTRLSLQNHVFVVSTQTRVPTIFKRGVSRETITKFSKSSSARLRRYLRTCVADYSVMLTLTYPHSYPKDGKIFKEHLRRFVQELKRKNNSEQKVNGGGDSKWSCFWFLEFQSRGAAHFHLFLTRSYPKQWIAELWFRIVGSDDLRHLRAGTRIEKIRSGRRGTTAYAAKYAAKCEQKIIPEWVKNAGRFWGVSGERHCVSADVLIPVNELGHGGLEKKLAILRVLIQSGVDSGQIGEFGKGTTRVYYMKNDIIVREMVTAMQMIELYATSVKGAKYLHLPHHEIGGLVHADSLHS